MRTIIILAMQVRMIIIASFLLPTLGFVACGDDDSGGGGPQVVATTGILADIAANVAGRDASVEQLIPDGSSPHDFQLSAEDRQLLEEADLIVADGSGLEATIPLDEIDVPRWELTANVGELLPFEAAGAHEHGDEGQDDEDEEFAGGDPHVWMDPTRVADALPSLAAAFGDIDDADAEAYDERASAYADELHGVDRDVASALASIPEADRELVTSHDALGYLADRYDLEVVATAFPPSGPEAEASAAQLDEVLDAISEHGVEVVFAAAEDDPETLSVIAEEAGVTVEDGLLVESPGEAGTYAEMLRFDGDLISGALGG